MFCTPIFCLIHGFFSLSSFVIPSKCLKNFICAASLNIYDTNARAAAVSNAIVHTFPEDGSADVEKCRKCHCIKRSCSTTTSWCSVTMNALTVGRVVDCRARSWRGAGDRRATDEYNA